MDVAVSQLTSKSILSLASEFTRANSVCPDDAKPSQNYLQLLSRNDQEEKRSGTSPSNNISSSISTSSFSYISKSNRESSYGLSTVSVQRGGGDDKDSTKLKQLRPYLVEDVDKKKSKNIFTEADNVFSKFGRLVGEQFGVYQSSKSLSDIKRSLAAAKEVLQKEIDITELSRDYHAKQIITLSEESKQQRVQLYAWALSNLIPDFEKMWSCRVRLTALLEEMAQSACNVLTSCRNEINFLLFEMSPNLSGKEKFLKNPNEILEMDSNQQRLLAEISSIERELNIAQIRVEALLPKLEPRSKRQRASILNEVISKHKALRHHQKKLFGFDHSTKWDHDLSMKMSGLIVETKDAARRQKVDRKFAETVSDERTREGRLLRRWCGMHQGGGVSTMVTSSGSSGVGLGGGGASSHGDYGGGGGSELASNNSDVLHPRSVLAFCKYFGEVVVGGSFEINLENNPEIAEVLTELATSLVFHRIEPIITNYLRKSADAERRDGLWRKRVKHLKLKTPEEIGIPKEFIDLSLLQSDVQLESSSRRALMDDPREELDMECEGRATPSQSGEGGGQGLGSASSPFSFSSSFTSSYPTPLSLNETSLSSSSSSPGLPPLRDNDPTSPPPTPLATSSLSSLTSSLSSEDSIRTRNLSQLSQISESSESSTSSALTSPPPPSPSSSSSFQKGISRTLSMEKESFEAKSNPSFNKYVKSKNRKNYWRTSLLLSRLDSATVPHEAMYWFMAAMRMLHKEAQLIAGNKPLDADTMFPILVYAAVQAGLPWIHQNLFFLRHFSLVAESATMEGSTGESDYYLTCTEAAISHVMSMKIDFDDSSDDEETPEAIAKLAELGINSHVSDEGFFGDISIKEEEEEEEAALRSRSGDLRSTVRGPSSRDGITAATSPDATVSKADRLLGAEVPGGSAMVADGGPSSGPDRRGSVKRGGSMMGSLFGGGSSSSFNDSSMTTSNRGRSGSAQADKADRLNRNQQEPGGASSFDDKTGEEHAMEKLGNWLGAQEAMEDTLDVLEQGGWMD